jgi:hypothetical protein
VAAAGSDSIDVRLGGVRADLVGGVSFEVVPLPSLVSVVPAQASVAGGSVVTLYGAGFAPAKPAHTRSGPLHHVISVHIGDALCANITDVDSQKLQCVVPSAAAATSSSNGSAAIFASVVVQLDTGAVSELRAAITYILPSIVLVQGADMPASRVGYMMQERRVVTISGNELVVNGLPPIAFIVPISGVLTTAEALNAVVVDGVQCRATPTDSSVKSCSMSCAQSDIMEDRSSGSGRVIWKDFNLQQITSLLRAGQSMSTNLRLTLASGVLVQSDLGTVKLQGPPTVGSLLPKSAATGESITIQGACFVFYEVRYCQHYNWWSQHLVRALVLDWPRGLDRDSPT